MAPIFILIAVEVNGPALKFEQTVVEISCNTSKLTAGFSEAKIYVSLSTPFH
jgi:hypothetical protein